LVKTFVKTLGYLQKRSGQRGLMATLNRGMEYILFTQRVVSIYERGDYSGLWPAYYSCSTAHAAAAAGVFQTNKGKS